MFFKKTIKYEHFAGLSNERDILCELENASKAIIKSKIFKAIPLFLKNSSSDYIGIFKLLTSKTTNFQSLLITNELLFFYELTILLKKCDKNGVAFDMILIKFMEKIIFSLKSFIEYFRKGLTLLVQKTFYQAYSYFTFQIIKHLNIIEDLLESKITEISSYEFLALPKFTLDLHKTKINDDVISILTKNIDKKIVSTNSAALYSNAWDSDFLNLFLKYEDIPEIDISIICFNYKCNYGYEPINYRNNNYVFTKQTERCLFHLTSNFINHSALYIKGASHSGKRQTFQVNNKFFLMVLLKKIYK